MKAVSWYSRYIEKDERYIHDSEIVMETEIGNFLLSIEDTGLRIQSASGTLLIELMSANTFKVKINRRM